MGLLDFLDRPIRVLGQVEEGQRRIGDLVGAGAHVAGRGARLARFSQRMQEEAEEGRPPGTAKFLWRVGGLFFGGGE